MQESERQQRAAEGMPPTFDRLDRLSKGLADRVIRRAIELHSDHEHGPATMSRDALDEIARELGVDPYFVDQAIAEELQTRRSGQLTTMERIFAPRSMRGGKVIHAPKEEVQRDVVAWLTAQEGLRPRSRDRGGIRWEKDDHWTTKLSLGLGSDSNKALRNMRRVTHRQTEVGEDAQLVELDVDSSIVTNTGAGLALGGIGAGVVAGVLTSALVDGSVIANLWEFLLPFTGASALGASIGVTTAKLWAQSVRDGLERALDGIANPDLFKRHSRRRKRGRKPTFLDRVEDVVEELKDILD